jgi:hypothetical protein
MTTYADHIFRCLDCPFSSSDPMAVDGHENHAPKDGWLGRGEAHHMVASIPQWPVIVRDMTDGELAEWASILDDAKLWDSPAGRAVGSERTRRSEIKLERGEYGPRGPRWYDSRPLVDAVDDAAYDLNVSGEQWADPQHPANRS